MALISCPECGRRISDKASACPGCGYPLGDEIIDMFCVAQKSGSEEKRWLKQLKKEKILFCPKCHSVFIEYENRVSISRALLGGILAGEKGALIGGLTGKKGRAVCLNCGKRWKV